MASPSSALSFHLLNSTRNHNSKNTPKFSAQKSKSSAGGEASSYNRLPPKHDSQLDHAPLYNIINLRQSLLPSFDSPSKNPSKTPPFLQQDDEEHLGFESDELDVDLKEKGVPAVMRCFDRAKIYVKSGDGGNGVVAFRREKFVPFGGPSGGDGGKGGDVYVEVDGSMNSLLSFRKNVHFRAGRGGHGLGRNRAGEKGEDLVVKVAPGTVVREKGEDGVLLLELLKCGERALVLRGGRGGRGNASFKSGTRKAPKIAENGEAGAEM